MLLINTLLFAYLVSMLNQFQNQWTAGLGKENEQNTPLNISNPWQTNLGVGPVGLFQQCGAQQYGMNSVTGLHALAGQLALLQAHQPVAPFLNHFSLPSHSLALPNQNEIAPQPMMREINNSEKGSPLPLGNSSSRTTQDDLDAANDSDIDELEETFLPPEEQEEV